MYVFYSLLLGLALLAVIPAYFVKLRILRNEPLHLRERLGFRVPNRTTDRPFLWIHAVSVGEVLSLQNLVHELKRGHPDWEIGFSTLTNSGYKVAKAKLREVDRLFFVPFDFGWAVRRYFKKLRPRLLVLVESEFWPRFLREARRRHCPALLVNGRISDRSFKRFKRWKSLIGPLFRNIDRFLVQARQDQERLEAIGIASDRIAVSGNLKCEVRLPRLSGEDILKSRHDLSIADDKKVIVAGSIHRGEEEPLLQGFREARKTRPDVLLILAPRHPEKFGDIERAFSNDSFGVRRKSQLPPGSNWDVLILDTIGDLARCYALSDAAFIGGSLIPRGGQNLLEPAFYGKPVFFGPHMENFAALADAFVRGGAARIIAKPEDLVEMFLFKNGPALQAMGLRAEDILASLQGATEKTLAAIEHFMSHGHDNP